MDNPATHPPRFLYVAACYGRQESTAYCLLLTSDEEHDPETAEGSAAIVRLLAQASERRDWFVSDEAFRDEVRLTSRRIGDEYHQLDRYTLASVLSGTGAWAPIATDPNLWAEAPE